MRITYGNLFDQLNADAICITTNGTVKSNGNAVMGRGCAANAKKKWPGIDKELGTNILIIGNVPAHIHETENYSVLSFPVKPKYVICNADKSNVVAHMKKQFKPGNRVPGWAAVANIKIIESSAKKLVELADTYGYKKIVLPRPGCGAGELNWENVHPVISLILDERFEVITFN